MRSLLHITLLVPLLAACLNALNVKVKNIDREEGKVKLLLPMHFTLIEAQVFPKGERIRVEPDGFYEARIIREDAKKFFHNFLRLEIPDRKPVKFIIKRIEFIDR